MYTNIDIDSKYPKTLIVRNHFGGMIWQVYHVEKEVEAFRISENATKNGFQSITLEHYQPNKPQTWEDWRETKGGMDIINGTGVYAENSNN